MNISDNVLKNHLKNVYWIAGNNCGGKTTMTKYLAQKYDMIVYDSDSMFFQHQAIGSLSEQPAMLRHFIDYEWFFNRSVDDYTKWILDSEEEQMSMIILDLIQLASEKSIIVDVHCYPDILKKISSYSRVVFILADPKLAREQYFQRADKKDMYDCIMSLSNPEKSLRNMLDIVENIAQIEYKTAMNSDFQCFIRDTDSSIEGMALQIEQHFQLKI
jgi:dephospho-CoA kinase